MSVDLVQWPKEEASADLLVIHDRCYGIHSIEEARIRAVIESRAFKRCRTILQHGTPDLVGWGDPVSRAEHMIGAMLLVRKAGGSEDEQLAALLHDVTHRAFSHVVDLVFCEAGSSLHEEDVHEFIAGTDLPAILGEGWETYFDESRWTLLEQKSPQLCADRGDYSPRDLVAMGLVPTEFAQRYFDSIVATGDGRLAISSESIAREFCLATLRLDMECYGHPANIGMYACTAQIFKRACEMGVIDKSTFSTSSCSDLWAKLKTLDDSLVVDLMSKVSREAALRREKSALSHFILRVPDSNCSPGITLVHAKWLVKPRFIDPLVQCGTAGFCNISQIDAQDVGAAIDQHKLRQKHVDVCFCEEPANVVVSTILALGGSADVGHSKKRKQV